VQPRSVRRERFAQFEKAEVVRVERVAGAERIDRRVADERGRYLVGLAEPEREHVAPPDAGVGNLADLRCAQAADRRARRDGFHRCQSGSSAFIR
jgi:hypothetical protein